MREICTIKGCDTFVATRGLCSKHYQRARRGKRSLGLNRTERVLAFIGDCLEAETDECLCPVFKSRYEYPSFVLEGVHYKVGWCVLDLTIGARPHPSWVMRHLCGNSRCCNPRHLTWGTELENAADRKIHGTEPDRRGAKNNRAQLTDEQVLEIKAAYRPYVNNHKPSNQRELALKYGVSACIIACIGKGKTWRHL